MSKEVCWLKGAIVPLQEAQISVMDHGLLYGDGVFEGIRFYDGEPFMLDDHLQRLDDSARAVGIALPKPSSDIAAIIYSVIDATGASDGYIRLVVTRGAGPLGIDPAVCSSPELIVIGAQLRITRDRELAEGVTAIIASTRRIPVDVIDPRVKSLNYLNNILARMEANRAGVAEAIMLNQQGHIAEATVENIFIVREKRVLTPPLTDGALAGVTRKVIFRLATEDGLEIKAHTLTPYDLYTADECFLSGTGAELIPVKEIDGRQTRHCPGPVFSRIAKLYRSSVKSDG